MRSALALLATLAFTLTLHVPWCRGEPFAGFPKDGLYGDNILVRTGISFGESDHQKLDLFLPWGSTRAPVVVCWFGGAFWGDSPKQLEYVARYFAAHGFAAVTPGYFLGAKDGSRAAWPNAVYDAKAAVRYVRANADTLKIDPDRIIAFGYSSGAYLAMMVGFTPNLTELEGNGGNLSTASRVAAVIEVAGVTDRRRDVGVPLALLGEGYESKRDLRVATSPVIYVNSDTVPTYILHGRQDSVSDVSSATQLADALKSANVPHELRLVETNHFPFSVEELRRMVEWLKNLPRPGAPNP